MRQAALGVICKAYRSKVNRFPLDDLQRLLAFDSREHVVEFVQHYDLQVQGDQVLLSRDADFSMLAGLMQQARGWRAMF